MNNCIATLLVLLLSQTALLAAEPDEISKRFTAAQDVFFAERDKAELALLESLTRKETAVKAAGDVKAIETLRVEIEAFRTDTTLPKSVPLTAYNIAMKSARTKLETVYMAAIKTATQADNLDEAKAIQKLLDQLRQGDAPKQKLRVMSYYSRHGEDGLQHLANVINSVEADIVALPSLERSVKRSGNVDQPDDLSKLAKLPHVEYGKNINFDGGEHGIAILSRWPIKTFKHHLLPMPGGGEQRGLAVALIELPNKRTVIFCAMLLDNNDKNHKAAFEYLKKLADAQPNDPVIVGAYLEKKPHEDLGRGIKELWTRAGDAQDFDKQGNYLLLRPAKNFTILKPENNMTGQKSGWKPLWSELELK